MLPLSEISSCALGTDFLVAPNGWQFLSMNIFEGYFPSWARNCLGRVLELSFWARGHFKVSKSECNLYFWSYNVMWLVKIGDFRDARYIKTIAKCLPHVFHMFSKIGSDTLCTLRHVQTHEIHFTANWKWSKYVGHPQEPLFWPIRCLLSFILLDFRGGGTPPAELYKLESLQTKG